MSRPPRSPAPPSPLCRAGDAPAGPTVPFVLGVLVGLLSVTVLFAVDRLAVQSARWMAPIGAAACGGAQVVVTSSTSGATSASASWRGFSVGGQ